MTWYVDVYVDEYDIQWSRPEPVHKINKRIRETIIGEFLDILKKPKFGSKGHENESALQYQERLNRWDNAMRFHTKVKFSRRKTKRREAPIRTRPVRIRIRYSYGTSVRFRDPVTGRFVKG